MHKNVHLDNDEEPPMDYEDSSEDLEGINNDAAAGELEESSEDDYVDVDKDLETFDKRHASRHSLEVRRAIEDHLERTRLRKELDYLYDDDFVLEDEEE